MNKLNRLEDESRDSIRAVLCDLSIRKLSTAIWYSKTDKKQYIRALASAVSFLDACVLVSVAIDDNADIRQEYIRLKNYVINSSPNCDNISNEIDSLSHISYYINNENQPRTGQAESLVEHWK